MDILKMSDPDIYEIGLEELTAQLGTAEKVRFLRQCKPSEYDYTQERHKWLANQPDIPTIAKRIQRREAERKEEERIKTERIALWHQGLLELTDIEIYELGLKVLADKLDAYGLSRFIMYHFKHLDGNRSIELLQQPLTKNLRFSSNSSAFSDFEERVSWSGKPENSARSISIMRILHQFPPLIAAENSKTSRVL
jgi:hypothetical protein